MLGDTDWEMVFCVYIDPKGGRLLTCLSCPPTVCAFAFATMTAVVGTDAVAVAVAGLAPIPATVISNSALALACLSVSPVSFLIPLADRALGGEVVATAPASEALISAAASESDKAAMFV